MIDAWWIVSNALWVSGCALALAVLSYANYLAYLRAEKMRAVLRQPGLKMPLYLAALLFCAGLAATASIWWETVMWSGLGLYALRQWVRARARVKRSGES